MFLWSFETSTRKDNQMLQTWNAMFLSMLTFRALLAKLGVLQVLSHLLMTSMQLAVYFCAGSLETKNYTHYALNVPCYTHFTSPIRRYADILV